MRKTTRFIGIAAERVGGLYRKRFLPSPAIGVDVGSHSIKIVSLQKNPESRAGFSVNAGEVFLHSDSVKDKKIDDFDSVLSILSFLCEDLGIKGEKAAISISGNAVFTTGIKIPPSEANSQKRIENTVKLHLEKLFPEGTDDCYCDFHPRDRGSDEVVVAVAKKDTVDFYVSVLSDSGIVPVVVDYDGFALVNAHNFGSSPVHDTCETTVLLNVGRSVTNLAVLQGSKTVLARDLSRSSEQLTLSMARAGNLTPNEAELAKNSLCDTDASDLKRVAREFALGIAREVKSNLDTFVDCGKAETGRVILSGGGSLAYGFRETVSELLRTKVEYADPFDGVAAGVEADYLKGLSPKAAVAFGLALRMV